MFVTISHHDLDLLLHENIELKSQVAHQEKRIEFLRDKLENDQSKLDLCLQNIKTLVNDTGSLKSRLRETEKELKYSKTIIENLLEG